MTAATVENGVVTADGTTAKAGDSVTLTVTPSQGYRIVWVEVNGTTLVPTAGEYGFVMPSGDCEIAALFEAAGSGTEQPPVATDVNDMSELKDITESVKSMQIAVTVIVFVTAVILMFAAAVLFKKRGVKRD